MSDIMFFIHAISFIKIYDTMIILCLRIITRHRKMRHWSFSNTIIPRLAAYLASLELVCVSIIKKGEG